MADAFDYKRHANSCKCGIWKMAYGIKTGRGRHCALIVQHKVKYFQRTYVMLPIISHSYLYMALGRPTGEVVNISLELD